jgi:hypothetical protein
MRHRLFSAALLDAEGGTPPWLEVSKETRKEGWYIPVQPSYVSRERLGVFPPS